MSFTVLQSVTLTSFISFFNMSFIIFAVPEDVHLLIRKAMYLTKVSAELIPVPNTEVITEEDTVEVSSATIKEFVLSKTQLLNEDLLSASTDTE